MAAVRRHRFRRPDGHAVRHDARTTDMRASALLSSFRSLLLLALERMPARAELRTPRGRCAATLPLRRTRCEGHRRYGVVGAVPGPGAQRADRHRARGEQGRQDCRRARRAVPRPVPDDALAACSRRSPPVSTPSASACRSARPRCRPASAPVFNQFSATLSASWEIDVFGKLRRQTESARANLLASEEGRRATILTLVASVASSYINLRVARPATGDREGHHREPRRFGEGVQPALQVGQCLADGTLAEPVRIRSLARDDPADRSADRAAGKFAVDPARPQSAADHRATANSTTSRCPPCRRACLRNCSRAGPTCGRPSRT